MPSPAAIDIDLLPRRDLAALVRQAVRNHAIRIDEAAIAHLRYEAARDRAGDARKKWQDASAAKRAFEREVDALGETHWRVDDYIAAAEKLRAAADISNTLFKILQRAEQRVLEARRIYDAALKHRQTMEQVR